MTGSRTWKEHTQGDLGALDQNKAKQNPTLNMVMSKGYRKLMKEL